MTVSTFTPDFSNDEYETRTSNAQKAMQDEGLDALFFTTEAEVRYFTGFRTLFWQSPTRPWFLIVPRKGKPIAVIPLIGAHLMQTTWLDDIRTFSAPHPTDDGVALLKDALASYNNIGMLMGRESCLRMPLRDFERLRDALPGSQFTDATALVQRLRMIKSEAEIAHLREICAIGSRAFDKAPALFYEGQTLEDVFRAFRIELLQQGAEDVPYLVGGAGPEGYLDVISPPTSQRLQRGDVLMLDTGASKRGYFCDFDRNFSVGAPNETVQRSHQKLVEAISEATKVARPGKTCADIYSAMARYLNQSNSDVGRSGHGLGMQLTEAPSLTDFDHTLLEEGMVLTLEPSLDLGDGKMMVHEENIVIRQGTPEFLSKPASPDIYVIER
ncbi:MAG: aminopeptidase P family protein [Rhodobacteraceae bacterium]|nr:aminopeptidase P family protein [Paracoccaceae bacterium]